MSTSYDVAIVGAGIVGLAHAWRAAAHGRRVVLFDRSLVASGASIRNFGMIWPIGQPLGERYDLAMDSRHLWLELSREAGIWVRECGSLHLAHRDDEMAVLEEFVGLAANQTNVRMLTPAESIERSPAAKPDGLLGSMFSPAELCVNPTAATRRLPTWLNERFDIPVHFQTNIASVSNGRLTASDGREWQADQVLICSGADIQSLYPAAFQNDGLRLCKLQMLRTVPQKSNWQLGTHLASGLTLRHYHSFRNCPSLPALSARIDAETPELNRYGIHVMASQDDAGHVVLGDSHEYDEEISPFDRQEIDDLILRELQKQITLPDWTIDRSWHGIYLKHPENELVRATPKPGVQICFSPGGAGMTLSLGWADAFWKNQ